MIVRARILIVIQAEIIFVNKSDLISLATSPIKYNVLKEYLKNHPDRSLVNFLINGFKEGFNIDYLGPQFENWSNFNEISHDDEELNLIDSKLQVEIAENRIAGPFDEAPLPNFRVSPIFLVPKRVPGEFRLIHNLSHPKDDSINDYIPDEAAAVKYSKIDDAINIIQRNRWKAPFLAKTDIKGAFKLLPIHLKSLNLLGFKHRGKYYVSKTMPQGCKTSCRIFDSFSAAVHWCLDSETGTMCTIHYIDDFLFIGENKEMCEKIMNTFKKICKDMGIPLVLEKSEGPCQIIIFLGLTIDTVNELIIIPDEKIQDLLKRIDEMLTHKSTKLKPLQSLIGLLNFVCRACQPGRAFMRRLIDASSNIKKAHHHLRISHAMKADLEIWKIFLKDFNGVSYWLPLEFVSNSSLELWFGVDIELGFAAFFNGYWVSAQWTQKYKNISNTIANANFKHLVPIVISIILWGKMLRNQRISIAVDNEHLAHCINNASSKDKSVMLLIRYMVLHCLRNNIVIKAVLKTNLDNPEFIKELIKNNVQNFRLLNPQANNSPEMIPEEFQDICKN